MPPDSRPTLFLIYTRDDVPLRLCEAFLNANADCRIHLITTDRTRVFTGGGDRSATALVQHRFETTSDIHDEAVIQLIGRVVGNASGRIHVVTLSESSVAMSGRVNLALGLVDRDFSRFVAKDKMKREASAVGVATPKYVVFDRERFLEERHSYAAEVVERVGLPCFAKPIALYGGMETRKINSLAEFDAWASASVESPLAFEVDEFITGAVYQCDSIICNGVTEYCQVSVSSRPWSEIYEGHNIGLRTVRSDDATAVRIIDIAERLNRHFLDGMSGVTCLELFVRHEEIVFLEIAYRPTGAGIASSPYFLRSSNVRINESHILAQVNPHWRPQATFRNYVGWVIVPLPQTPGRLKDIHVPKVNCELETYWNVELETDIGSNDGINTYAGGVLLWSRDYQELRESYDRVVNECRLEVETRT